MGRRCVSVGSGEALRTRKGEPVVQLRPHGGLHFYVSIGSGSYPLCAPYLGHLDYYLTIFQAIECISGPIRCCVKLEPALANASDTTVTLSHELKTYRSHVKGVRFRGRCPPFQSSGRSPALYDSSWPTIQ